MTTVPPGLEPQEPHDAANVEILLRSWTEALRQPAGRGRYLLVSHEAHFLNPLVPSEEQRLRSCSALEDPVLKGFVAEELLPRMANATIPSGLYFPVPMARTLAGADPATRQDALVKALGHFHYDMAQVDQQQRWTWRGQAVAERTRDFFLEHLYWEPAIQRWAFEYKVHDGWWDKSYLDAELTPLRAVQLEASAEAAGHVQLVLQTGRRVAAQLDTLRLDEAERLFCDGVGVGAVLFSDGLRFQILATVDEALTSVEVLGERRALAGVG